MQVSSKTSALSGSRCMHQQRVRTIAATRGRVAVTRIYSVARPSCSRQHPKQEVLRSETRLSSTAVPLFTVAAAEGIRELLQPSADYFRTLDLPEPLVHWGHPGNMMVVLLAMGGYGALTLGWQIRLSNDRDVIAKAKDMHPKLAFGMFFFFALGAIGGMMSLIMQDKPIFESPHVVTGLTGLALLSLQATLPALFKSQGKSARDVHAYLGTATLALFLVHAGLGLKLGLSI